MNVPRWYPAIIRLPNNRLLVYGGDTGSGRTNTAEIYNVATNTWTLVGSFDRPQDMPPGMLLYTGEALKTWSDPELFNLTTNTWSDAAPLLQVRDGADVGDHSDHMSVMFPDGRVGVFGIDPVNPNPSFMEIYDPISNTWSLGSSPLAMRQRPEAMVLPGGKILAYGGEYTGTFPPPVELGTAGNVQNVTNVTDLYDPLTNTWRGLDNMNRFIHYHNVSALLPDGRVIDTGGAGQGGPFGQDMRVEAFEPPYLFRGVRPKIDFLSTTELTAGAKLGMKVSYTSSVTSVVLIGTRATTHWIDSGTNRYISLSFSQNGSRIRAKVPDDAIKALSGWYLLYVMVDDIPSEARIVRINDPSQLPPAPSRNAEGFAVAAVAEWVQISTRHLNHSLMRHDFLTHVQNHVPAVQQERLTSQNESAKATRVHGDSNRVIPSRGVRSSFVVEVSFSSDGIEAVLQVELATA